MSYKSKTAKRLVDQLTEEEKTLLNQHLTAIYILLSLAMLHTDEFTEILNKYNLVMGNIKHGINGMQSKFDVLRVHFLDLFSSKESKRELSEVIAELQPEVDKLLGFTEDQI